MPVVKIKLVLLSPPASLLFIITPFPQIYSKEMLKNNTISSCLIASMCSGRLYPAARLCFFQRWLLEAQTGRELAHSFMGTYCI